MKHRQNRSTNCGCSSRFTTTTSNAFHIDSLLCALVQFTVRHCRHLNNCSLTIFKCIHSMIHVFNTHGTFTTICNGTHVVFNYFANNLAFPSNTFHKNLFRNRNFIFLWIVAQECVLGCYESKQIGKRLRNWCC